MLKTETTSGRIALAVAASIESPAGAEATNAILYGVAVLLGPAGIAAQRDDARRIVADGGGARKAERVLR